MRFNLLSKYTLPIALMLSAATALAAGDEAPKDAKSTNIDELKAQLAKHLPGAKPEDVRKSPIPGVYEITMGTSVAYMSADGKYLITGDLYEVATKTNLSDARRSQFRVQALAGIREADTIVFGPKTPPKHTITVFIDVDCGYCRKLHSEMAELNKLGIRVRYTAYPRSGPGSPSWAKMEAVWCSKDRRVALTKSQMDEDLGPPKCGTTPVASQYKLGDEMGVNGTPAIFTETGDYIGGYLPPQQLLTHLDELKAESAPQPKKGGS
jgi:thiol:disulfide interchange protein DsbC